MSPLTEIRQRPPIVREQIRGMLRSRIISGDLRSGAKVTQTDLSRRLAVIRGPLREAIIQFTKEGLLVKAHYCGLRVRSVRESVLVKLNSIRTTLERLALAQAREQGEDETISLLRNRYQRLEAASERRDLAASGDGEASFHSWSYRLTRHGPLRAHWNKLVRSVQICMPFHQKEHRTEGVFMFANAECLKLVSGIDLGAVSYHICHYMQQGLRDVSACIPKDEAT